MNFRQIDSFGGIDADEDELLRDCFRDHPAYLAARDHNRWLVVGRKGSGKTAIFKRLITERAHDHFAYGQRSMTTRGSTTTSRPRSACRRSDATSTAGSTWY